jgi:hypothetical protein
MAIRDDAKITIGVRDRTKAGLKSISSGLLALKSRVAGAVVGITALIGVGGLGALTAASFKSADAFGKMGDRLNLATESFAGFALQAQLTGTSSETVNVSLERMVKRIGEAKLGFGAARGMLQRLNVDIEALSKMRADEQYQLLSDKVAGLSSNTERAAAVAALFGREALSMINMISQGAEGFKAAQAEAEGFGRALSRIEVAQIENMNDQMTRVKEVFGGLGDRLAVRVAPYIDAIASSFLDATHNARGFDSTIVAVIDNLVAGFGYVANTIRGVQAAFKGFQVLVSSGAEGILGTLYMIADGWRQIINLIPGVEINPMEGFEMHITRVGEQTQRLKTELAELVAQGLPADNFRVWADEIVLQSERAAGSVAAAAAAASEATTKAVTKDAVDQKKLIADVTKYRENANKNIQSGAIGLLRTLGANNRAFAYAAIALEKGLAIAKASMNTSVAITKALSVDPTGGLAARVAALGKAQIAIIAATGLAQASQIGSGGAGAGTAANPIQTTSADIDVPDFNNNEEPDSRRQVNVYFNGYNTDEMMLKMRDYLSDTDFLVISESSRQYAELRS